jgi:hypothetical protein
MRLMMALLPYLLLAANTALLLVLFFGMNQRVRKLLTRVQTDESRGEMDAARISSSVKELNNRIAVLEKEGRQLGSMLPGAGLNSNLRGKVLKMHRLGQPAERIAETLRVPRGQVDLLVKVHAIVMRSYQAEVPPERDAESVEKG